MSETIAVIGAGQMGNGIAHVAAMSGYTVNMIDVADAALEKGRSTIASNMERQVKKGTLDAASRDAALSRISTSTKLDATKQQPNGSTSNTGSSRISTGSHRPAPSSPRTPVRSPSPPLRRVPNARRR
jgi:pyruvate/2-oxoglutarate dehydrogenase complex dihydrolipoamide dehydrogenase (E3) component